MVWKLNVQFEFMKGGSDNAFFIQKKINIYSPILDFESQPSVYACNDAFTLIYTMSV